MSDHDCDVPFDATLPGLPMNQRNVDALQRIIEEAFDAEKFEGKAPTLGEFLASRGCLGPASEVLTDEQAKAVTRGVDDGYFYGECDHDDHGMADQDSCTEKAILGERLERIAKGDTP